MKCHEIYALLKQLNIGHKNSTGIKTLVILFYLAQNEDWSVSAIAGFTHFNKALIYKILGRLIEAEIIDEENKKIDSEFFCEGGNDITVCVTFALFALVGEGKVKRFSQENNNKPIGDFLEKDYPDRDAFRKALNKKVDAKLLAPFPCRPMKLKYENYSHWIYPQLLIGEIIWGINLTVKMNNRVPVEEGIAVGVPVNFICQIHYIKKGDLEQLKNKIINGTTTTNNSR